MAQPYPLKILNPLIGIEVEGFGEVCFDMTMEEAKKLLGDPSRYGHPLCPYYDHLGIRMEFDSHEQLVSFFFGKGANIQLYGVDPMKVRAVELVDFLKKMTAKAAKQTDSGHSHVFSDLGIKLWRHHLPEEIKKMLGEEKGSDEEGAGKWEKKDLEKSLYFDLIYMTQKGHYDTR